MATTTVLGLPLLNPDGEEIPAAKFNEAMRILDARFAVASSLETSLVAFWRLNEASGTRSDSWSDNHLTDNNTVTGAVGRIGNAAQFTAANSEYLSVADNAALSMGDFDFSFAGWVYLDSLGALRGVLGKSTGNAPNLEYQIYVNASNQLEFYVSSDGTAFTVVTNTSVTLSASTWYFVAAWHDASGNTINLSVNNGTAASAAHSTGVFNGSNAFRLGSEGASSYFNGRLDAWGVWKKVLSAGERTTLYNGGSGLETPFS